VLVDVNAEDPTAEKILPAADLLAQIVSERMRKTLGGSESGPLPVADSVVKWSQLGGSVVVAAHHDGTFAWRKDTTSLVGFMEAGELDRIVNALSESAAAGDRVFWPDSAKEDSLSFRLAYAFPMVRADKKIEPLHVRVANPVFTIQMPWFSTAKMSSPPRYPLPRPPRKDSQYGIILDFVVDSTGRVDPATISEYVPPGFQPVAGEAEFHRSFRDAAIRGLPSAQFQPATIGGCAISQHMRQPVLLASVGLPRRR
jgi:hypothetical protein